MPAEITDRAAPERIALAARAEQPRATPHGTRRTRVFALAEARWAAIATIAFACALGLRLTGAPTYVAGFFFVLCYLAGGWEPALAGLRTLARRALDVDLLMVVAAIGAAAIGQVTDGGLLIVIFATSGALEALATARTEDSVRGLLDLAPATATRLTTAGDEELVPSAELLVGDTILVRPGERVGADGRVIAGASEVDQASITGEPLPVAKHVDDQVFAGTLNGTGALRVRVERDAADSVIARIVAMVEQASRTKAPTQLFIERVEQRYAIGMVLATIAVFVLPLAFGGDATTALLRAMTFMIVASPCAVVLATMPPLLAAIATAGRHGVLVKSAVVMEQLGQVDVVALDKTGTLTAGTPRVTHIRPLKSTHVESTDADTLLTLAASAEAPSEHPLARAIVAAARERELTLRQAHDFASVPGVGVSARVGDATIAVTAPERGPASSQATDDQTPATSDAARELTALAAEGVTAVVVTRDGVPIGVLGLADRERPDAAATVAALTALTGAQPTLLTGDNPHAAARLAEYVGITEVRAGLLPADKAEAVAGWQHAGRRPLVVGDGVNDAPALAAAHVGVAMGRAGSDLALETADAVVVRDELAAIPVAVRLSRAARRLVTQNLVIAATFISGLVVWDLAGHLPLPLGVLGHEGSTVIVGLNGLRLLRDAAWRRAGDLPSRPASDKRAPGRRARDEREVRA
jgi:heavy metal translocating P-type ATPase